ncbi:GID complex subunit containing RING finger motif [Orbilia oligospora]|uniref:GID complex subunit containing RING finger motif n=1 Tax=Orbilia oligospora TaxID=2813651 RepID=A0A7C8KKK1_ORBOL|nr:GID complex subunit containing RING finger motif [Orbilia oligospora]KAF3214232.1 GID complex subunit containing RING finger motif [Orbilia oligospora]KAF3219844.1 GID complex subunit containing RING finger motif [Orbilia oligospora]
MTTKSAAILSADNNLLLEEPLLRLPLEVLRKIFKSSQRYIENDGKKLTELARDAGAKAPQVSQEASLESLNAMITRMQTLKRKMETLHEEEKVVHAQSRKRVSHLNDLHSLSSLLEDGYESWSKIRLDRFMVDYMLRNGYSNSAKQLAQKQGIEELVDVDVFVQCWTIEESLRNKKTTECLAWCAENKNSLKKIKSTLEFELRLQVYIEYVRERKLKEAVTYSRKYLSGSCDTHTTEFLRASCILAFPPERPGPYKALYAEDRWDHLVKTFVSTHHSLYNLPQEPLLHVALAAGLSSLKTPSCHSTLSTRHNTACSVTSLCPICSTELNELAKPVPYGHHTTSWVDHDLIVLPNGRVYGTKRLSDLAGKLGLDSGKYRDPISGEEFERVDVRKVFIS